MKINGKKEASLLLAGLDDRSRERILKEIGDKNPDLAATLRKGLVSFQQVLALDPLELQKVIQAHPIKFFALALRGLDAELKKNLFSKFSERQGRALNEEIESLGPQKLSDVTLAQEKIIEKARELHENGLIRLK